MKRSDIPAFQPGKVIQLIEKEIKIPRHTSVTIPSNSRLNARAADKSKGIPDSRKPIA
jgi:hypothetical protein